MFGRLRFESESHYAEMGLTAPISSLGEIHVKGHEREAVFRGPSKQRFVVTLTKASLRRVDNRVAIHPKGLSYFNSDILVEKEPVH